MYTEPVRFNFNFCMELISCSMKEYLLLSA